MIHHDGIHHFNLLREDNGSCSMRYKLGIVVSFTLILEEFKYVALNIILIIECLIGDYAYGLVSPW
jgi:hypothetical protein